MSNICAQKTKNSTQNLKILCYIYIHIKINKCYHW